MLSRRLAFLVALTAIAGSFFMLGVFKARADEAAARTQLEARFARLRTELLRDRELDSGVGPAPTGTSGDLVPAAEPYSGTRAQLVADLKRQLQSEMGLLPVRLIRERRSSFVELYADDSQGKSTYGTAGYLGNGYFITVKHAVVSLPTVGRRDGEIASRIRVVVNGREEPAVLVDAGDATAEVQPGDWALIKTRQLDLPPLRPRTGFAFEFAEPILRFGNDYSKGIIASTGYIGQRMANGLVTALTDGHPGASGGGVLDTAGDLVGIPIGRMPGDYRFSFILPLRDEMLRRLPR